MDDSRQNGLKDALLRSCHHLLRPIVRMLLRGGVTWAEFAELGKEVYVDVARSDYGLQGRPTNASRVAMLTGLSRREVGRVRDIVAGEVPREPAPLDRLSQVLTGWHTDQDFLAGDGTPLRLVREGESASMAALLQRYAGDMPHGAVLKELEQLGLVVREQDSFRVTARSYIRSAGDEDRIRQAGIALHDHASTVVHNVDAERTAPARFERMATTSALPVRHANEFQEFAAERGQVLLEEIDGWLTEHCIERHEDADALNTDSLRCGLGVYLIYDESRGSEGE